MMIEIVDRYDALGIPRPDQKTMCKGQCEGTGCVPVYHSSGDKNAKSPNGILGPDEDDPVYLKLWMEAEAEEEAKDGWHFVKCPDCGGSGKARQEGK